MTSYAEFLDKKTHSHEQHGFAPSFMPSFLFDFQSFLLDWSIRMGRSALMADCGTGKTPMKLVWAENVVRHTNGRVLDLNPLAVAAQTAAEAEKFGIEAHRSYHGELKPGINITNYERLHLFDPNDFEAVICDESSILKSFEGARRGEITEFMRKVRYRLLTTATAAPNDYTELGTSSEALGYLGYMDMLTRFFKNDQNTCKPMVYRHRGQNFAQLDEGAKWRFKGHAEIPFWRWVSSWARALRRPSDFGFDDGRFVLPPLIEREHIVKTSKRADGMLFSLPAVGLAEQRDERRRSIEERCERAAALVSGTGEPAFVGCHLNPEGDLLARLIPDAVQVSGKDSDEEKEEKFLAFASNQVRVLITKPKIGAWGLNFQHCAHVVSFPSHSYEQWYQWVRRCYRFGQARPVVADVVASEGEVGVLKNMQRKAVAADKMFSSLVAHMNEALAIDKNQKFSHQEEVPSWL